MPSLGRRAADGVTPESSNGERPREVASRLRGIFDTRAITVFVTLVGSNGTCQLYFNLFLGNSAPYGNAR
jgi:hypothetical protein